MGYATSYYGLLFIVIIFGLGSASFHPQAAVSINVISDKSTRGISMGTFSVGGNLGFSVGALGMAFLLTNVSGGVTNTIYFAFPGTVIALLIYFKLFRKLKMQAKEKLIAIEKKKSSFPVSLSVLAILLLFIFIRSTAHTGLLTFL